MSWFSSNNYFANIAEYCLALVQAISYLQSLGSDLPSFSATFPEKRSKSQRFRQTYGSDSAAGVVGRSSESPCAF
jgi:hypothetical protein